MHTVFTDVDVELGCLYIQLQKKQSLCSVFVSYVCEDLSCLEVNAAQFLTEANWMWKTEISGTHMLIIQWLIFVNCLKFEKEFKSVHF